MPVCMPFSVVTVVAERTVTRKELFLGSNTACARYGEPDAVTTLVYYTERVCPKWQNIVMSQPRLAARLA